VSPVYNKDVTEDPYGARPAIQCIPYIKYGLIPNIIPISRQGFHLLRPITENKVRAITIRAGTIPRKWNPLAMNRVDENTLFSSMIL